VNHKITSCTRHQATGSCCLKANPKQSSGNDLDTAIQAWLLILVKQATTSWLIVQMDAPQRRLLVSTTRITAQQRPGIPFDLLITATASVPDP
jgi:hypothetical protein